MAKQLHPEQSGRTASAACCEHQDQGPDNEHGLQPRLCEAERRHLAAYHQQYVVCMGA